MIYFVVPPRFRWILLLAASYYFYARSNGKLVILIMFSTLVDYLAALKMSNLADKHKRKPYLILSLVVNLGVLGLFKYYDFFIDSFVTLFSWLNISYAAPALSLILPVGISFYTLQTLAYSIDVYKGKQEAEKHLGYFALYVCYFPQLVAGPIERAGNLLPELKKEVKVDYKRISDGLKLMGLGFFKKVVIADQIAPMIQYVTADVSAFGGFSTLLCLCLFAYQVYCDFSAYSDIAIGAAQVMGIKLMLNFRRPFVAKSLSELWTRWHISLILWFRDYIFNQLGGIRKSTRRIYINTMIVFLISGLWHGASWTFVIWGAINGLAIVVYRFFDFKKRSIKIFGSFRNSFVYEYLLKIKTYLIFSIFGIFFLLNDLDSAAVMFSNLISGWGENISAIIENTNDDRGKLLYLGYSIWQFLFLFGAIIALEVVQYYQERYGSVRELLSTKSIIMRWSLYMGMLFSIIFMSFDKEIPFIYFQF